MTGSLRKNLLRATLVLPMLLAAPNVLAQSGAADPRTKAHGLYEEAIRAFAEKDYESACPKLEEVVQVYPEGLGAWIELGRCEEARGHLARAFEVYSTAEAAAVGVGQTERAQRAGELARAVEPRLSRCTLVVPESVRIVPGVVIRLDGREIERASWDKPLPVDGGLHKITIDAPTKRPWSKSVNVEREKDVATVRIPLLDDSETERAGSGNPQRSSRDPISERPAPSVTPSPSTSVGVSPLRAAGFVGGGLGTAGILGGVIAGGIAIARHNDAIDNGHCLPDGRCNPTGGELEAQSRSAGTASTALFVVGSVLLAGGVTMAVVSYSVSKNEVRLGVAPNGLSVGGTF